MNPTALTTELVAFSSPSHQSNRLIGEFVARQLDDLAFETETIAYTDAMGVDKVNIVGRLGPTAGQGLAYFGHSDVVPADDWSAPTSSPTGAEVHEGRLYGRGTCDMKGSLACMLSAIRRVGSDELSTPVYFVCTADEEIGYVGAKRVVAESQIYREMVDSQPHVLIGEPTGLKVVHAHKGICTLRITSHGESAHSATAEGCNANLAMIPFLQEMKAIHDETETDPTWRDPEFSPPTVSWNIGINDFTRAANMKPNKSVCTILFRPLPETDAALLIDRVRQTAKRYELEFEVLGECGAVYTPRDDSSLVQALALADCEQAMTVAYGTDGGVLVELDHKFICGPGEIAQAHTANEWIALSQLDAGVALYEKFMRHWCLS